MASINTDINPFHVTGLFLYPIEKSENGKFPNVYRGYKKRSLASNGLAASNISYPIPGYIKNLLLKVH